MLRLRPLIVAIVLLSSMPWTGSWARGQNKDNDSDPDPFQSQVVPLLRRHCYDCHGADLSEGNVQLDRFLTTDQVIPASKTWNTVLRMLQSGQMPPEDSAVMSVEDRQRALDGIRTALDAFDCQQHGRTGHVTMRRLNRTEYQNTIRDLLGVEFAPAAEFPGDDVGYGFDNIGDVLSLSPLLMEKYLDAAEEIVARAIVIPHAHEPVKYEFAGGSLTGAGKSSDGQRHLATRGEARLKWKSPVRGKYEIELVAYGDQAGDEPARMAVLLHGRQLKEFRVTATQNRPARYSLETQLREGEQTLVVAFVNDFYDPDAANPRRRDRNLHISRVHIKGPLDATPPELPETHQRIVFARPGKDMSLEHAAGHVLRRLGSRAFRRPIQDTELKRLVALTRSVVNQGGSYEEGLRVAVQAILVSPHFLFKVELDPPDGQPHRPLNDYEYATRLSYFLWNSMPDDLLFADAWSGRLREGERVVGHLQRMLQDPRADSFITSFAGQWLQLRNLETLSVDRKTFPHADVELLKAMRRETELFFAAVVREDLSVHRLLDAPFTFVNERLARHYGLPRIRSEGFERISLEGTRRGGLLTQASLLTLTSNPSRTSPVKRGKFILENLLGIQPPPPPPDVPDLESNAEVVTGTLRQRLELHRSNPGCAACHQQMDPLGFALENFDATGRWRTEDNGQPIDAGGELPTGEQFNGVRQLRDLLVQQKRDQFVRCLIEKLLTYALGRGLEYYDQCVVDEICEVAQESDGRFSAILNAIITSEPFQRQGRREE